MPFLPLLPAHYPLELFTLAFQPQHQLQLQLQQCGDLLHTNPPMIPPSSLPPMFIPSVFTSSPSPSSSSRRATTSTSKTSQSRTTSSSSSSLRPFESRLFHLDVPDAEWVKAISELIGSLGGDVKTGPSLEPSTTDLVTVNYTLNNNNNNNNNEEKPIPSSSSSSSSSRRKRVERLKSAVQLTQSQEEESHTTSHLVEVAKERSLRIYKAEGTPSSYSPFYHYSCSCSFSLLIHTHICTHSRLRITT
jgi:hypothetical protein